MQPSRNQLIAHRREPSKGSRQKTEAVAGRDAAQPRSFRVALVPIGSPYPRFCGWLVLLFLTLATAGCGSFVARRMAQAPNSYPQWFGSLARVELAFDQNFLTNFPERFTDVGPSRARLSYRIVEPADYHLQVSSTNGCKHGRPYLTFDFHTTMPGQSNVWTVAPRGTVVLLHGYGLAQFAMAPWAMRLAEDGWRCVLVDLRGHGKSTGKRIYFGVWETQDLTQLLDALARDDQLAPPVAAVGESYGAALALRWKGVERRIASVVAIAPYAELSNAVMNICHDYAKWLPAGLVRSGLRKLPAVLEVAPAELDTTTALARNPVVALFVAGADDKISPATEVRRLYEQAATGSELVVVPHATHEALPYYFDQLVPPVLTWLHGQDGGLEAIVTSEKEGTSRYFPSLPVSETSRK
jgi:pimeloyl-ACP methyl ester carboxylesterase